MDKAAMAAWLRELSPQELRVLKYEVKGGHDCNRTSSLYHCCGEARCEACHIPHLKEMHDEAKLYAYEKFVDKWQLTWQGYMPTKQKKENKKGTHRTVRQEPKVAITTHSIVDAVDDDNIDAVLLMLVKKLGKEL